MIERVFAQLKLAAPRTNQPNFRKPSFKPLITISRDAGSGGRPIAALVAKRLGFEPLGKKIVEEIAKSAKLRRELIKTLDEKNHGAIDEAVRSMFDPDYISDITYIRQLTKVILAKAHKGKVVILGRGANFIVPKETTLRVRIHAPYSSRVRCAIRYEGLNYEKARETIRKIDEERAKFVKHYFGKNIINGNYYDLTINTDYLGVEAAAELIIFAFRQRFGRSL